MNPNLKRLFALLAGVVVGSAVNMALVNLGPMLVPLPEGVDVSTMEGLRESMSVFRPVNFLPPFLAHALGTLAGAWTAARIAVQHALWSAMLIGVFFLAGGIMMAWTVGGPAWFLLADLLLAYLPMAWLGARLSTSSRS